MATNPNSDGDDGLSRNAEFWSEAMQDAKIDAAEIYASLEAASCDHEMDNAPRAELEQRDIKRLMMALRSERATGYAAGVREKNRAYAALGFEAGKRTALDTIAKGLAAQRPWAEVFAAVMAVPFDGGPKATAPRIVLPGEE